MMPNAEHLTPYQRLGGEAALRGLVDRFYGYMDTMSETATVRGMHPEDLTGSKDRLFKFLSGWLGGPNLYREEFGHPRLRMRHFPFSIGRAEAEQWLSAMRKALNDTPMDASLREKLFAALTQTAHHMINRPE
ncbi:MAG: group II truncated hemoglobin [Methylotetracoccus sp.]|nr:group II truncated hemoglobin [Methylotetracoccus sp.]